jgi:hypothetical protein
LYLEVTNVRSSISSSDIYLTNRPLAPGKWLRAACVAMVVFALFVAAMEFRLASRGFHATVLDTDQLWLQQRQRASDLGGKALVIVGASRVQLDLDLDVLRHETKLEPVQLAVDGSSFIPVLNNLAQDPRVTGTVMVEYEDGQVDDTGRDDRATQLSEAWTNRKPRHSLPDFAYTESMLSAFVREHVRSYADGARPLTSLLKRVMNPGATPQYLVTMPSRTRLADYRRVSMPSFYYSRVIRNLGEDVPLRNGMLWSDVDAELKSRVARISAAPKNAYDINTAHITGMVRTIEARGGRVVFLAMPTSGLIREIDTRRYPRADYWDRFDSQLGGKGLDVADHAELNRFHCPDGSHLDFRDRAGFTGALVGVLGKANFWVSR